MNYRWLTMFRVLISAFCLIHFCSLIPDIHLFLSYGGIIAPDIIDARADQNIPTLYDIAQFLNVKLAGTFIYAFSSVYILSLISLLLGLFTRFSAFLAASMHIILLNSINLYIYGVDCFSTIALFYCIVFPAGQTDSLDNVIFKRRSLNIRHANYALRILQIHLCIAYFFGGFDKVLGYNWRNGESIWKSLHLNDAPRIISIDFINSLADTPVFVMLGWATIVIEMAYPLFMNISVTRPVWLCLIIGLHLSIFLSLGLFFFSTFMIILSVSAYLFPYLDVEKKSTTKPVNALSHGNTI